MLLTDIQHYLKRQQRASLVELSRQFQVDPQILQDMLAVLIRKGQVQTCTKTPHCGVKCTQCTALEILLYEWVLKT